MQDYYLPNSWYEQDIEPDYHCHKCDEAQVKLDTAAEYLTLIVKKLYSIEKLDIYTLESDLDDLCYLLDVKIDSGDLQIQRKLELPLYLTEWSQFNQRYKNYLEQLTQ